MGGRLSYDVVVVVSELRKEWLVPSGNATLEHPCYAAAHSCQSILIANQSPAG